MTMEILKVQDLCKTYGKGEAKVEALKKVSFSLDKGEFAAVVGESGSGKSTLLNCIGALDTPTSGHIWIDEQDLFSMKEEQRTIFRRRNIGFIFQSFQLVSELNVEQNIMFPLLLDYRKPDPAAVEEILELLGLTERRHHLPSQLSGGQQQRVAIGTVLGLFCNKLLFGMLISYRWGDAWTPPLPEVAVILLIVISSVILAVHGPIKRIRNMSIVDTISAQ